MARTLPASFSADHTKTYSSYKAHTGNKWQSKSKPPGYKRLDERESTEWDLRFDVDGVGITPETIINNIKANRDKFLYVIVSGVEMGRSRTDRPIENCWITKSATMHVHVGCILNHVLNRLDVLKLFRPYKAAGEYCMPRKQDFPYIGMVVHHKKMDTKMDPTSRCLYESGTLPMDNIGDDEIVKRVRGVLFNYGTPEDRAFYRPWVERYNAIHTESPAHQLELLLRKKDRAIAMLEQTSLAIADHERDHPDIDM